MLERQRPHRLESKAIQIVTGAIASYDSVAAIFDFQKAGDRRDRTLEACGLSKQCCYHSGEWFRALTHTRGQRDRGRDVHIPREIFCWRFHFSL